MAPFNLSTFWYISSKQLVWIQINGRYLDFKVKRNLIVCMLNSAVVVLTRKPISLKSVVVFCHSDLPSEFASAVLNKTFYFSKSVQPFKFWTLLFPSQNINLTGLKFSGYCYLNKKK